MTENKKQAVFILGMHRSGTSALAGVLSRLGIYPGTNLIPSHQDVNPKGFWEHKEIVELHDQIFGELGITWDNITPLPDNWWEISNIVPLKNKLSEIVRREFDQAALWLLKDPRLCRLLPMWLEILKEFGFTPYFILCVRNPLEVAESLQKRDKLGKYEAVLLWLVYVLESEKWSRGCIRTVVTFDSFLDNWRNICGWVEKNLDVKLSADDPEVIKNISEFIEPGLKHYNLPKKNVINDNPIYILADKAYQLFLSKPIDDIGEMFSELESNLNNVKQTVLPLFTHNTQLRYEVQALEAESQAQQAEIARIKTSLSWNVTKPLRLCIFLIRKILGQS